MAVTYFTLYSPWFCRKGLSSNNWSAHTVHSGLHSELCCPDSAISCAVCFAAAKAEVVPPQQVSSWGLEGLRGTLFFFAVETHSGSWVRLSLWSNLAPCFHVPLCSDSSASYYWSSAFLKWWSVIPTCSPHSYEPPKEWLPCAFALVLNGKNFDT